MFCEKGSVLVFFSAAEFRFSPSCRRNTAILFLSSVFIHAGLLSEGSAQPTSLCRSVHTVSPNGLLIQISCPEDMQVRCWIFILDKKKRARRGFNLRRKKRTDKSKSFFNLFFFFFLACSVTGKTLCGDIDSEGKCLKFLHISELNELYITFELQDVARTASTQFAGVS